VVLSAVPINLPPIQVILIISTGHFAPSERAIRINERLQAMNNANADSLRMLQNDNFSVMARTILPRLLDILNANCIEPRTKSGQDYISQTGIIKTHRSLSLRLYLKNGCPFWRGSIWNDEFGSETEPMEIPSRDRTYVPYIETTR
jgi:penicillin amidase